MSNSVLVSLMQAVPADSGPPTGNVQARFQAAAATKLSCQITGLSSTQLMGLTQVIITGGGATGASVITVQITGLSSAQVGGAGIVNFMFAVPAIAVTADPAVLNLALDPPLQQNAISTPILVEVPSFGSGNTGASLYIAGKIVV